MSNRPDGKTFFVEYDLRTFETSLNINAHELYWEIKKWIEIRNNKNNILKISKMSFIKQDIFDIIDCKIKSSIKINGIVYNNNINDFDIFEEIYLFLEFMVLEFNKKELIFVFGNKVYKIINKSL
jgi:hypothetical protein